jgi:hypothetical protein
MKNIFILFVFLPVFCFSQNCKYSRNEVDEFTGKSIQTTKQVIVYTGLFGGLGYKFTKINNSRYLEMGYSALSIITIEKGDALMFILGNGEKIELSAIESKVATPYTSQSSTIWGIEMDYFISENDLLKMINSPISKLRIYTKQGYVDKEVRENKAFKIQEAAKCIK